MADKLTNEQVEERLRGHAKNVTIVKVSERHIILDCKFNLNLEAVELLEKLLDADVVQSQNDSIMLRWRSV